MSKIIEFPGPSVKEKPPAEIMNDAISLIETFSLEMALQGRMLSLLERDGAVAREDIAKHLHAVATYCDAIGEIAGHMRNAVNAVFPSKRE